MTCALSRGRLSPTAATCSPSISTSARSIPSAVTTVPPEKRRRSLRSARDDISAWAHGRGEADEIVRPHRSAVQLPAGRVPQRGDDGGRRHDRGEFADALRAEGDAGLGFLDERGGKSRRVEGGRDEIVGERRIEDPAVLDLDLFH